MEMHQPGIIKTGSGGDLAFGIVVAASYLAMFSVSMASFDARSVFLLILLGVAYMAIGIYGYRYVARVASLRLMAAYFAIQIPLSAAIVYVGRGAGFNALVMLPLAGHGVILLPRRWALGASAAILPAYMLAVRSFNSGMGPVWAGLPTFLAGLIVIVVFTQIMVSEKQAREEVERLAVELADANQRLREYAAQVEELATDRERNRLAREIHDGLGHYLTSIGVQIQAAQAVLNRNPKRAAVAMDRASKLAEEALTDVRRSVSALRAFPDENTSLSEKLTPLVDECRLAGLEIDLRLCGEPRRLSPAIELAFYRAAQEGLNNVRKHSGASQVSVVIDYTNVSTVCLFVEDDGRGSDNPNGGFGLIGLRERAHLLGGDLSVSTRSGEGFKLKIEVPS
jgi:signal transduction histidine kinase